MSETTQDLLFFQSSLGLGITKCLWDVLQALTFGLEMKAQS